MRPQPVEPEKYLYLQENGIDIDGCKIDYKMISVRCEDLSLYRKAFRVKIRSLIKQDDMIALKGCVDQFYTFAQFVQYLYGFHSCVSAVEGWQEKLAYHRQRQFVVGDVMVYRPGSWLSYACADDYKDTFKKQYMMLSPDINIETLDCVQDEKPFLNLKDRSHFDRCFTDR